MLCGQHLSKQNLGIPLIEHMWREMVAPYSGPLILTQDRSAAYEHVGKVPCNCCTEHTCNLSKVDGLPQQSNSAPFKTLK